MKKMRIFKELLIGFFQFLAFCLLYEIGWWLYGFININVKHIVEWGFFIRFMFMSFIILVFISIILRIILPSRFRIYISSLLLIIFLIILLFHIRIEYVPLRAIFIVIISIISIFLPLFFEIFLKNKKLFILFKESKKQ